MSSSFEKVGEKESQLGRAWDAGMGKIFGGKLGHKKAQVCGMRCKYRGEGVMNVYCIHISQHTTYI